MLLGRPNSIVCFIEPYCQGGRYMVGVVRYSERNQSLLSVRKFKFGLMDWLVCLTAKGHLAIKNCLFITNKVLFCRWGLLVLSIRLANAFCSWLRTDFGCCFLSIQEVSVMYTTRNAVAAVSFMVHRWVLARCFRLFLGLQKTGLRSSIIEPASALA